MTSPPELHLPWGLEFEADAGDLTAAWRFDAARGRLHVTVRNETDRPVRPGDVRLEAELGFPATEGNAWLHGRYMQMDALVRHFGAPPEEGYDGRYVRPGNDARTYVSRDACVLTLPAEATPCLLAGSLRMDRFFVDVEVRVDEDEEYVDALTLVFDLEGIEVAPGEEVELPPVLLVDGRDAWALMGRYADEVAREMDARVPGHVPAGWCSWYYFYDRVSEADVLNLEAMVADRHPAEYVQIDDGYQSRTGDWLTPNEKFPSGMKALADRIREAGYRPGIWLAPFVMHEESAILRDRPEMALKTNEGETFFVQTWLGRCAVLDCTHPSSEEWLRDVFKTVVVSDWGYEYLKLDALAYAARPPGMVRYHQPGTTAPGNLRRGLEVIRQAAGNETFILGCTCHFGPAVGLVDAMRVGPDVKDVWFDGTSPSVKHAMRMTLQRNWMHNRWWVNDPDCLLVRDTDTSLNPAETRFLASAIALSGGMVVASDDLPKLSEERRAMAMALVPPVGVAARPVSMSGGPVPAVWRADIDESRSLLGILNWDDSPRWAVISELLAPGERAFDVWNGMLLGKGDVLLAPHEGALWQVTAPAPGPRLVGDTGHVNYARLYQRPVSGRLQVRNDDSRLRTIAIEARGQAFEVDLPPGVARWFD